MASNPTRFVIIGNGAAGTYAAEQLRKDDAAAEIIMIDDEKYTLYNRVSLPRYLKGVLLEQRVTVRDMEWHVKNRIDLRLETKVTQVNFEEKTVATEPGSELKYDKLLIATGGRPNPLKVPGSDDAPYLFNFQYFDETKAMVARIPESKSRGRARGLLHRLRADRGVRVPEARDALAPARTLVPAPLPRRAGRQGRLAPRRRRGRAPPLRGVDREARADERPAQGPRIEGLHRDRGPGRRGTRPHDEHRSLQRHRARDQDRGAHE